MIKQYKVTLMNAVDGIITHFVNTNNEISARCICEEIFKGYRVIDIVENI